MTKINLTAKAYFSDYITRPFAKELTAGQKARAFISTLALTILTVGFIFLVPLCLKNKKIKKDLDNDTTNKIKQFAPIRNEFHKYLEEQVKQNPQHYPIGSTAIMKDFDTALNKEAFFSAVDEHARKGIGKRKDLSNTSAQLLKKKVDELLIDNKKDETQKFLKYNDKQLHIGSLNLTNPESHRSFPKITEARRYEVRDNTLQVLQNISDIKRDPTYQQFEKKVELFKGDSNEFKTAKQTEMLGRFDVLRVPCAMNFDQNWDQIKDAILPMFYIHHGAALNIGESANSPDFPEYKNKSGGLDETKYIADMGKVFRNILVSQKNSGENHAVWFPFGMGAFLRHLPKMDATYKNPQRLCELRQLIAREFVKEVAKIEGLNIHLCLPADDIDGSDTNQNYNAFVDAIANSPQNVKDKFSLYVNVDATALATQLAREHGDYVVGLANGANRNLIGNHWFEDRALTAIDENIHRRSSIAALLAVEVNGGMESKKRSKGELADNVVKIGGSVSSL